MITVDLHMHTLHSHAHDSVQAMYASGRERGLTIMGFSEHSPRPEGYDYPVEYREHLQAGLPTYVREVRELQQLQDGPNVLFGMEVDWLEAELPFVRAAAQSWPFDYLIGGVHFLGTWGFDASADDWACLSTSERHAHYEAYFLTLRAMAQSGLFHIAAHPDIIKLFSVESFRQWLQGDALDVVRDALVAVRDAGMGMEISSAGLRKPCREIYPGPVIMRLAADLRVPITFASDAHTVEQVGFAFPQLAAYAAEYGYTHSLVFRHGGCEQVSF